MMKLSFFLLLFTQLVACQKSSWLVRSPAQDTGLALNYMDDRMRDWLNVGRTHSGQCLSCHTSVPYAMARPAFGQTEELENVRKIVEERVKIYKNEGIDSPNLKPWYDYPKESFSTESVANSITLIYMDKGEGLGQEKLSKEAKASLDWAFEMQIKEGPKKGGFLWLDMFNLKPFEAKGGEMWGASMLAVAIGESPGNYKNNPMIQDNLKMLKEYLGREFNNHTLHEQLMVVWADHELGGGILTEAQIKQTIKKTLSNHKEGGWSIHKLLGVAGESTPDGYATGMVTNILLKKGLKEEVKVQNAVKWIRTSQNIVSTGVLPNGSPSCGSWFGMSPNSGEASTFFTDISTSYSMLTLKTASKLGL
jgi:squalene-hopene/tetraprenyl-beta-curcumene cyclase